MGFFELWFINLRYLMPEIYNQISNLIVLVHHDFFRNNLLVTKGNFYNKYLWRYIYF